MIGVIAGLAAQTTLGNLFAGLQIAFTDAIRIDDIVVVQGLTGRIEEITLTYVAVIAVDSHAPLDALLSALREELGRTLERSAHWDRGHSDLFVEDATAPAVKLIAVVTAVDGDAIALLRREVREGLLTFLQQNYPAALPGGGH